MLQKIAAEVVECRACPRLVQWRERMGREKRASYRDDVYWAKGVPGFGDPNARLLVVGLAPAAHGANRTGRMFTGDRSGDWLYAALHHADYANQPHSKVRHDGLVLSDVWITTPVKCAPPKNRPTPAERDNCIPYLEREIQSLSNLKVVLALGGFAYQVMWNILGVGRRPKFAHGVEVQLAGDITLLCSYHVSQQNTFTGRLTKPMFDAVLGRAKTLTLQPHPEQ